MLRFRAGSSPDSEPSITLARRLLLQAAPLALTSLITLLYLRADLFIVAALSGAREAGLFQSSFRIFEATFVVSGGISAGTFPLLAERLHKEDFTELCRFVLSVLLGLGLIFSVVLFALSDAVIGLVYGSAFTESAVPLSILALGLLPLFVNALTTHLLVAAGRNRRLIGSMLVRLCIGVLVDLVLVPTMGASGAAVGVASAEWGLMLVSLALTADLVWPTSLRAEEYPCA
jgi:PST family polysaccharide transporter